MQRKECHVCSINIMTDCTSPSLRPSTLDSIILMSCAKAIDKKLTKKSRRFLSLLCKCKQPFLAVSAPAAKTNVRRSNSTCSHPDQTCIHLLRPPGCPSMAKHYSRRGLRVRLCAERRITPHSGELIETRPPLPGSPIIWTATAGSHAVHAAGGAFSQS